MHKATGTLTDWQFGRTKTGRGYLDLDVRTGSRPAKARFFVHYHDPEAMEPEHVLDVIDDLVGQTVVIGLRDGSRVVQSITASRRHANLPPGVLAGIVPEKLARPPQPIYTCFRCERPFTSQDTTTVGIIVETKTGCVRKIVHARCEPATKTGN